MEMDTEIGGEYGGWNESAGLIDRISELPDEIRESILGYLPICDAVRTSILSQKWRYSWTRAPQLNIDFYGCKKLSRDKYCKIVGRVLLFHVGPIRKFVLSVSWYCRKGDMNAWVQFLSRNGIKDLTIHSRYCVDSFDIPPSLYQCSELSRLSLGKCDLRNTIAFKSFPKLVRLHLYAIQIYEDILEKIISSSPLEMLFLENCCFSYDWTDRTPCISAPNLRILDIICEDRFGICYFKNTPNLLSASFKVVDPEDDEDAYFNCNCFDILGSMPHIESLYFDCPLHKTLDSDIIPKKLPEGLVNLKTMTLNYLDVTSVDHLSFMFCIIRSSPNLQHLVIDMRVMYNNYGEKICKGSLKDAVAYLEAMGKEEIQTSIRTLSVTTETEADVKKIGIEIALVRNIVSCCSTLEKLSIKAPSSIKGRAKLRLSRALRRFGRSSSKPKIIITFSKDYY